MSPKSRLNCQQAAKNARDLARERFQLVVDLTENSIKLFLNSFEGYYQNERLEKDSGNFSSSFSKTDFKVH